MDTANACASQKVQIMFSLLKKRLSLQVINRGLMSYTNRGEVSIPFMARCCCELKWGSSIKCNSMQQ